MTFAVIKTGGKQYKVQAGQVLKVEKLVAPEGTKDISFDEVLLVDDGQTTKVGKALSGVTVPAKIIADGRAKKITVIHYKNKVRYFKKMGHRQPFTEVEIGEIPN